MEVILLKEVSHLGNPGDVVNVKNGYANNYLLPQKLVVRKTPKALEILEKQQEEFAAQIEEKKKFYQDMIDKVEKISKIVLLIKASKEGKTFGTITNKDIQKFLKTNHELELERKNIIVRNQIKTLGSYDIDIFFNKDFSTKLIVELKNIDEPVVQETQTQEPEKKDLSTQSAQLEPEPTSEANDETNE